MVVASAKISLNIRSLIQERIKSFRPSPEIFRIRTHNCSKAILNYHNIPEKDITLATLKTDMRKLKERMAKVEKRVNQIPDDLDGPLTPEEIASLDRAEEAYRSGRTVRIV